MRQTHKREPNGTRTVKKAVKKTGSALAKVANGTHARRLTRNARGPLGDLAGRTTRFIKRNPVRVLLGATALGLVVAKLRQIV
jgi:hypothetical protein